MQWLDVFRKVAQFLNQISQSKLQQNSDIATAIDNDPSQIAVATDTVQHQVSKSGCELICGFEGLALTAYDDGTGCWTIGYGTTRYPDHTAVKAFDTCSVEDAKRYMQYDLKKFEYAVNQAVVVNLSQNQFDALVSLSYNIGMTAFKNSTLLRDLNAAAYQKAADQFDVWIYAKGKKVQGLINRRAVEKARFKQ